MPPDQGAAKLNPEEQAVMDHILAAMDGIHRWGLRANATELAMHVHGLQGFVIQHMLQRSGDGWGEWYERVAPGARAERDGYREQLRGHEADDVVVRVTALSMVKGHLEGYADFLATKSDFNREGLITGLRRDAKSLGEILDEVTDG